MRRQKAKKTKKEKETKKKEWKSQKKGKRLNIKKNFLEIYKRI
jgi:hypothetical protein